MQRRNVDRSWLKNWIRPAAGIALCGALVLVITAGSAAAKQVYDYKYSGTFIDGTGSEKGPFSTSIGDVVYDQASERLNVVVSGSPSVLQGFTKAGAPSKFSALNLDYIDLGRPISLVNDIAIDQSGGPGTGFIFLGARLGNPTFFWGYKPNGLPISSAYLLTGTPVNPTCGVAVTATGEFWVAGSESGRAHLNGETLNFEGFVSIPQVCNLAFDSNGFSYGVWSRNTEGGLGVWAVKHVPDPVNNNVGPPEREWLYRLNAASAGQSPTTPDRIPTDITVDRSTDDVFLSEGNNESVERRISQFDSTGGLLGRFGGPEPGYTGLRGVGGITVDPVTHDVWATTNNGTTHRIEKFQRTGPFTVPTTDTGGVTRPIGPAKATLHGTVNPDGLETTDCYFEYGTTPSLGTKKTCAEGKVFTGTSDTAVSVDLTGLAKGTQYWYKLFAKNSNNRLSDGGPERFIAQGLPIADPIFTDGVNTDGARFNATIDPNGGRTYYHWEYGPTEAYGASTPETRLERRNTEFVPLEVLPASIVEPYPVTDEVSGLTSGATYHVRLVTKNEEGTKAYPDQVFRTYLPEPAVDECENSLVRQQTRTSLLLDCRAYELASAMNTGGHDVVSDLVPGQVPLPAYPAAAGRLLYSVDSAVIPGVTGNPTNLGRDPYVATRHGDGWTTEYAGLPSDGMADPDLFGSPLLGADSSLSVFAFGGQDICDPCFEDGSTNIPLRLAGGQIIEGMAGALDPEASGNPSQEVVKPFSGDGTHFVFGSDAQFETLGVPAGSIYDRDLNGGGTQVVSTLPNGTAIPGGDVAELDISDDGSRIVLGKLVSTDAKGNKHWHLYMHIGTSPNTVDLTEGSLTEGAIYAGMSADGRRVFFISKDNLLGSDSDVSADIYEVELDGGGTPHTRLITTKSGVPSNDDTCEPPGIPANWNSVSGEGHCNAVAFAGGAGVSSSNGTLYFVSPEMLDGSEGIQNQANLYRVEPGSDPSFVETIDSSIPKAPPPLPSHPVANPKLVEGLSTPNSIAVDQSTDDLYVFELGGGGKLARYTAAGAPNNFSALGTNKITGLENFGPGTTGVAVDNAAGSPLNGRIYATDEFEVDVFAANGEAIGGLSGFALPCGVAVDQSNGDVYVADPEAGAIWRFHPTTGSTPVENANYTKTGLYPQGMFACQLAVDQVGHVYASEYNTGPLKVFNAADFHAVPEEKQGTTISPTATAMATDPANDNLYVNEGNKVTRYTSSAALIQEFGAGTFSASSGIAVNKTSKHVYVPNGANIVDFGFDLGIYEPIDNPAIVHGVRQSGVHSYGDFQVTPDGDVALFNSALSLTGYSNLGHLEIYRYDANLDALTCPSCAPSLTPASADTTLSLQGLNLTNDGRVFFTTPESFVLRDSNRRLDVYEWKEGTVQLISTGISAEDATLLSVSHDGVDAYFFTRDKLVENDANGGAVRIYDAREHGGFFIDPPPKRCAASDECHGAGTPAPPPPNITTRTGSEQIVRKASGCRKGFVKRHGRCVKKKKKRKRQHRRRGQRNG